MCGTWRKVMINAACLFSLPLATHGVSTPVFEPNLRFKQDGTFKVVQLTDLHLGENQSKDANTIKVVHAVLNAEKDADLVVVSGDAVSGFVNRWSLDGWYEERYRPLAAAIAQHGMRHAMILGNHDDEGALLRHQVIEIDMQTEGSLSMVGFSGHGGSSSGGAGNYWLDVLPYPVEGGGGGRADTPAARLWFLDSMSRGCGGVPGWGCVHPQTVAWLRAELLRAPPVTTSAAFIHIPVPEYVSAWRGGASNGTRGERVCCPSCNSDVWAALREGGVNAIYSGHDHDNDFVAFWQGTRLAYGRKTGYGSYGPPKGLQKGARVIIMRESEPANVSETYLRLEDGSPMSQDRSRMHFGLFTQWACASGLSLRQAMLGTSVVPHHSGLNISGGVPDGCHVTLESANLDASTGGPLTFQDDSVEWLDRSIMQVV